MNTQTISQFEPLDTDLLAAVEGGGTLVRIVLKTWEDIC